MTEQEIAVLRDIMGRLEALIGTNGEPKPALPARKMVKPTIDYQAQKITLINEIQAKGGAHVVQAVHNMVALFAHANKSGSVTEARELALLGEIWTIYQIGSDPAQFCAAVREMQSRNIPNMTYLKKVYLANMERKADGRKTYAGAAGNNGGGIPEVSDGNTKITL